MPPRAAPPAALLTSLTVRAGWVWPQSQEWVSGGSGLRPDPTPGGRICRFRYKYVIRCMCVQSHSRLEYPPGGGPGPRARRGAGGPRPRPNRVPATREPGVGV